MLGARTAFAGAAALVVVGAALWGGVAMQGLAPDDVTLAAAQAAFVGASPATLEDPAGDASDTAVGDPATLAACAAAGLLGHCAPRPAASPALPASPAHLDIVSVGLEEETPDEVVLTLGIARLDEGFPDLAAPSGLHRMAYYGVCWDAGTGDACVQRAYLAVMRHADAAHLDPVLEAHVPGCNDWSWCSWTIEAEVRYGSPGVIAFHVPKAWAQFPTGTLDLHAIRGYTGWSDQPTAFPMWHGGFTVHTPARFVHHHAGVPGTVGIGDVTADLPLDVALQPPPAPPAHPWDAPLFSGRGGATHAEGSAYDDPALDLVGFDLHEEDDGALVATFALQEAAAPPTYDFDDSVAIGLRGGKVLEMGWRQEGGEATGYAGQCIMEECQDAPKFEVPVEFIPGAPAFVVVRVPREAFEAMGGPFAGEETTLVWVTTMNTDGSRYVGHYGEAGYGDVHQAFMADSIFGGIPYVFGSGHRAPLEAFAAPHAHG